jgi:hypothetical protein
LACVAIYGASVGAAKLKGNLDDADLSHIAIYGASVGAAKLKAMRIYI